MTCKIFVDGQEGTTGLRIHEYLSQRADLEILHIPQEQRKDVQVRQKYLNEADLVFLCLPDQAAREAVALIDTAGRVSLMPVRRIEQSGHMVSPR